jgi:site-specific DNA recombinase
MGEQPKTIRCAVYTRKSTEEGLEQEFNSLHAQREAAENFIASQKAEGWICLSEPYDDGGFTGGNMERPALKKLMEDVRLGRIDTVIVYKIDRLSRSLLDFAELIGAFDKYGVRFRHPAVQHNDEHGAADAEYSPFLRPV